MTAVVIFVASLIAIILFALGTILKCVVSAVNTALSTAVFAVIALLGSGFIILILAMLYMLSTSLRESGIWGVLGTLLLLGIIIGVALAIFGGIGVTIGSFALVVAEFAVAALITILEYAVALCETAYGHSLAVIVKRLDQC